MNPSGVVSEEEFLGKISAASAAFDVSGIVQNDELDQTEVELCLLIPESSTAVLIGKGGANVNAVKATSGSNVSFTKKANSVEGLRKCFVTGTLAQVSKAMWISIFVVGESQMSKGESVAMGVIVNNSAAGSVIGKGGQNLKNIREQTSCHTNMEKQGAPMVGGRTLQMRHPESPQAVFQALYLAMRLPGFQSQTNKEDRALANNPMAYDASASYGYGPAATSHGGKARFSPYGASGDTCALHGKRRGKQNLQPSPTMPGQMVCFDHDQCKGNAVAQAGAAMGGGYGAGAMGGMMGYDAMGGMMGGMGLGGMMGTPAPAGYGMDLSQICAIHNKKRGAKNLIPHPTVSGLYTCMDDDQCKGQGGASADTTSADAASVCATHGKRRGARNLQPHPTTAGLYVCLEGDLCK